MAVLNIDKQVTRIVVAAFIVGVGGVIYTWASWTTETLIAVDKRTEVMATQIEFIKAEMERTYGNLTESNEQTGFHTAHEEGKE